MRLAVEAIGEVTGQVYTDDILDRVFGRFCIGK
jgi:tRNA modification GTPase